MYAFSFVQLLIAAGSSVLWERDTVSAVPSLWIFLIFCSSFSQLFLTALAVQSSAIQAYCSCRLTHSALQQGMSMGVF